MLYVEAARQLFPGKATFTEDNIADQSGKVFLVTGANTGIGKEVARVLYAKNGTVWIGARSQEKAEAAMADIRRACPDGPTTTTGRLEFLRLDLGDLEAVRRAADDFRARNDGKKLHVLFNNAGVMFPPKGSKTAQGYELQLGTNCLGPFLLTKLLTPMLAETAKTAPKDQVRVVWLSSSAAEHAIPRGGIDLDNLDYHKDVLYILKYGASKAGNYYYATEYARRHREDGIVSVSLNPGNIATDLDRHCNFVEMIWRKATVYPGIYGAYTELFAGLSDAVTAEKMVKTGDWVVPWGRVVPIRKSLRNGSRPVEERGSGVAQRFWFWSEEQIKPFI